MSGSLDTSMADALLAGGAKAVAGYVNNVYTVYSRSMLWDTVNHLILGQTLQESVQHSMDTYGADDLVWYNAQGGKRPHAAAAYPLLFGDVGVRLIEPNAAPARRKYSRPPERCTFARFILYWGMAEASVIPFDLPLSLLRRQLP